jgi:hypothetical protein
VRVFVATVAQVITAGIVMAEKSNEYAQFANNRHASVERCGFSGKRRAAIN